MARIFLDANYFIDAIHRRPEKDFLPLLEGNIVYISPLSIHIYCYIFKIKMPNSKIDAQVEKFQIVDFTEEIKKLSLRGPTEDFEDNVQLRSAAEAECEVFFTEDKRLLDLKFFGKTRVDSKFNTS